MPQVMSLLGKRTLRLLARVIIPAQFIFHIWIVWGLDVEILALLPALSL